MMKKICSAMLCAAMLFGSAGTCSARFVESKKHGIGYEISDDWMQTETQYGFLYTNSYNESETVHIEVLDYAPSYYTEVVDSSILRGVCLEAFSNGALSDKLSVINGTYVTISNEADIENYEYYNGVKYYRFEKSYTATASGFEPASFYISSYITAKNGKLYMITHERDGGSDNTASVMAFVNTISYWLGMVKINVNNERVTPDSAPIIVNGRTLVPIRAIADKLGYTTQWDGGNRLVTITSADGGTILSFGIDSAVAFKNDTPINLDVPAMILYDRTYLPLRAVADAMDARVSWDGGERLVEIFK